ncbi:MAG: hypothetical protein ACXVFN_14985 [Solirubrobacteraceae bacterium]
MTLLDAEPVRVRENPAQPPSDAPQPQSAGATTCVACGAEMAPEQDWCLSCGAATAGSLGEKPGWRAFSTIAALTLVLVLGAVAASYAALSSDKRKPAVAQVAPPAAVAQAAPPAAPTTSTPAQPAPAAPAAPSATKPLPKVKAPSSTAPSAGSPVTPVTPPVSAAPKTSVPKATTPKTSAPSTSAPRSSPAPSTSKSAAPVAIKLDPGAGSTYDPFGHAAASGEASRALDGDASTSWYLDPKATDGTVGAGYVVNAGSKRSIKRIELTTTTPGFRVEVYATDEATPPPDVTDTRWSHITNASDVGKGTGQQTIVLGAGTSKYQTVLLWITQRPTDGARVRISELKLFG